MISIDKYIPKRKYFNMLEALKVAWKNSQDRSLMLWSVAAVFAFVVMGLPLVLGAVLRDGRLIVGGLVWAVLALLVFISVVSPRHMRAAMKANGVAVSKDVPNPLSWLVFRLRLLVVNALSWYDIRLFYPVAALVVLGVVALLGGLLFSGLFVVGIVLLIIAMVVEILVNSIASCRTGFAAYEYLRGDGPEKKMPRKSHDLVKGQTIEVFVTDATLFGALEGIVMLVMLFFVLVLLAITVAVLGASLAKLDLAALAGATTALVAMWLVLGAIEIIVLCYAVAFWASYRASFFAFYDNLGPVSGQKPLKIEQKEGEYNPLSGLRMSMEWFQHQGLIGWNILTFVAILVWIGVLVAGVMLGAALGLAALVFLFLIWLLAGWVMFAFLLPRVTREGLRAVGMEVEEHPLGLRDAMVLVLKTEVVSFLCWYDKRLLAPAVALLGLGLLAVLGGFSIKALTVPGIVLLACGAIAWLVATTIHGLRLQFAMPLWTLQGGNAGGVLRQSHGMVKGRTLEIYLAIALFVGALGLALEPLRLAGQILGMAPCIGIVLNLAVLVILMALLVLMPQVFFADLFRYYMQNPVRKAAPKAKTGLK